MTLFVGLLIAVPHYWAKVRRAEEKKPTALWYLAPKFFGAIGGILGWLAVKDEDRKRARILLIVGILLIFSTPGIGGFLIDYLMPH